MTQSQLVIDYRLCLSCGACVGVCPFNALTLVNLHLIANSARCEGCRFCVKTCPVDALSLVEPAAKGRDE